MIEGVVIIPTYNNIRDLRECLVSVKESIPAEVKVLVIDNGSDDNIAHHIREEYPWVWVVRLENNVGFAAGCNYGVSCALVVEPKLLYFLNDDTTVAPGFWQTAADTLEQQDAGIIGSVIITAQDHDCIQEAGSMWDMKRFRRSDLFRNCLPINVPQSFTPCDTVCGAGFMITTQLFRKMGGFDESYFCYYEDTDLCLRAISCGYKVGVSGASLVFHKGSQTSGLRSSFTTYYTVRNAIWMAGRHMSMLDFLIRIPGFALQKMVSGAKWSIVQRDARLLRASVRACWDGMRGHQWRFK